MQTELESTMLKNLYQQDFNLWVDEIKNKLENRELKDMDWDNLIDEVEDMGKSEKRSLESYLERLIEHILKLNYWESERERNGRHWKAEIVNFRNRIKRLLKRSPSLKRYLEDIYEEVFQDAVASRQIEFNIPKNNFIELEQILKQDFFGRSDDNSYL